MGDQNFSSSEDLSTYVYKRNFNLLHNASYNCGNRCINFDCQDDIHSNCVICLLSCGECPSLHYLYPHRMIFKLVLKNPLEI